MVSYLYRMDEGYQGALTREPAPGDVTQAALDPSVSWSEQNFGIPVVYNNSGQATPVTSTTTASDVIGFLVRPFPGYAVSQLSGQFPSIEAGVVDVARRGYMAVKLQNQTQPVKGGKVYIRINGASTGLVIGGIEAASNNDTIELTGATFEGAPDGNGIVEISFSQF